MSSRSAARARRPLRRGPGRAAVAARRHVLAGAIAFLEQEHERLHRAAGELAGSQVGDQRVDVAGAHVRVPGHDDRHVMSRVARGWPGSTNGGPTPAFQRFSAVTSLSAPTRTHRIGACPRGSALGAKVDVWPAAPRRRRGAQTSHARTAARRAGEGRTAGRAARCGPERAAEAGYGAGVLKSTRDPAEELLRFPVEQDPEGVDADGGPDRNMYEVEDRHDDAEDARPRPGLEQADTGDQPRQRRQHQKHDQHRPRQADDGERDRGPFGVGVGPDDAARQRRRPSTRRARPAGRTR